MSMNDAVMTTAAEMDMFGRQKRDTGKGSRDTNRCQLANATHQRVPQ